MERNDWYGAYVFDMDGTVYLGDELLPTVARTLGRIREKGIPVRFLSNNPTKTPRQYLEKLTRLGLPAEESEIVNTLVSTTGWLQRHRPDAVVFPIGEPPLVRALSEAGIELSDDPAKIDIVLASYDRSFEYRKLQTAFDALWYHKRAVLMSTNPDKYCPFPGGRGEPDCASIVAAIEACTGVKCERTFGKPSALMVQVIMDSLGVSAADAVMVGDRLMTDIAMGRLAGMDAALVLTGDSRAEDIAEVPAELRPTRVLEYLSDLLPRP
ncbi:MAG: HAD-IIA family hydrolase [Propionibacteriaceae bacterium]|jgi:HAD superfamily hydrolase (TIGR01450 family)|nr:HAD-IIA family hydrolase [Propionibacteriaceae bacterium]